MQSGIVTRALFIACALGFGFACAQPVDEDLPDPVVQEPTSDDETNAANDAGTPASEAGSGDSEGQCTGVATPCSFLTAAPCQGASGCTADGACSGINASCSSNLSSGTCSGTSGCLCCSSWHSHTGCGSNLGCFWRDACAGTPRPCSLIGNIAGCLEQPGCTWQDLN